MKRGGRTGRNLPFGATSVLPVAWLDDRFDETGLVAWPLLACLALTVLVTFERLVALVRAARAEWAADTVLCRLHATRDVEHALGVCASLPGALARIVSAGLLASRGRGAEIAAALQHAHAMEVASLRSRIDALATLARVAVTLGMLRCLDGLVTANGDFCGRDTVDWSGMVAKVYLEALPAVAVGLIVGGIAFAAHVVVAHATDLVERHLAAEAARVHAEILGLQRFLRLLERPPAHVLDGYR